MVERQLRQRGIHDERVLAAMYKVPRHEFVSRQRWSEAYADHPGPHLVGEVGRRALLDQLLVAALA